MAKQGELVLKAKVSWAKINGSSIGFSLKSDDLDFGLSRCGIVPDSAVSPVSYSLLTKIHSCIMEWVTHVHEMPQKSNLTSYKVAYVLNLSRLVPLSMPFRSQWLFSKGYLSWLSLKKHFPAVSILGASERATVLQSAENQLHD